MIVGVVGLGTMGLGVAQVFAGAGLDVVGFDAGDAAREAAAGRLAAALDARAAAGRLDPEARDAAVGRFRVADDLGGLSRAGLVVEAIVEELGAKRALMEALEGVVGPGTVLATNTSSLSVAAVAEGLARPGRVLGLHFFNPAPAMRLVELVGHAGTAPGVLAVARNAAERAGKTVVDAPDRPGFVVNRVARPFYGEALAMLEEGREAAGIDAAMVAAGYRMGPFALIDLVGADVHRAATRAIWEGMGRHPRYHVFPALDAQVAAGALGRKAGRGFVWPDAAGAPPPDADAVAERIEAAVANEAGWLLAEGGVTADGIDTALRLGLNWPRGPFEMLAQRGAGRLREVLAELEARSSLRGRYAPAPMLEGA